MNVKSVFKELRTDSQGGWCASKSFSTLQLKIYVPMIAVNSSRRTRSVIVLSIRSIPGIVVVGNFL